MAIRLRCLQNRVCINEQHTVNRTYRFQIPPSPLEINKAPILGALFISRDGVGLQRTWVPVCAEQRDSVGGLSKWVVKSHRHRALELGAAVQWTAAVTPAPFLANAGNGYDFFGLCSGSLLRRQRRESTLALSRFFALAPLEEPSWLFPRSSCPRHTCQIC